MNSSLDRRAAVELQFFDPATATGAEWQRLHGYRRQRAAEDAPDDPVISDAEFETDLKTHRPLHQSQRILALRDDAIVGNLVLGFRRPGSPEAEDHADHIDVGGGVAAAHRRQGVGRTLAAGLVDFMALHGKSIATGTVHLPQGHHFMKIVGAACNFRKVQNRLPLSNVDWDALGQWASWTLSRDPRTVGLRWELHAGRVPMDVLAPLMGPLTVLINQQPLDTLDQPRIRYQLEGYETWYADMDRRGGEHLMVLLRDGDELAAVCDASWDQRFPDRLHQALTAVAAPWRGLGLAKAVKARMLLLVQQRLPQVQMVNTFNAQANAAMLSINRRLGFAVHKEEAIYQITRERLCAYLSPKALAQ
ncbi:N-acetyltransferase [Variovorax sp. LARHSF232]